MRIDVHFTPSELSAANLEDRTAIVIDVLRATSTIVEALANGARGIYPVASAEEAVRLAQNLHGALLCGERRSLKIEGFHFGNSPAEFTPAAISGRTLVMATTNGTPALVTAGEARIGMVASFLNLNAAADAALAEGAPVTIICAGRERRFALEDAVCAGALAGAIISRAGAGIETNDGCTAALELAEAHVRKLESLFRRTAAGQQLLDAGLESDIPLCASIDRHAVVPRMRDRMLVA